MLIPSNGQIDQPNRFERRLSAGQWLWTTFAGIGYFAWFYGVVGLKTEHVAIFLLVVLLYFAHLKSRQFLFAFAIFLVYTIVFDSLRAFPNTEFNTVHIRDLYETEKYWFGVNYEGEDRKSVV